MQQIVTFPHTSKDLILMQIHRNWWWKNGFILQPRQGKLHQLHPVAEIHAAIGTRNEFCLNTTVLSKHTKHSPGHCFFDLQQGHISVANPF